MTTLDEALLHIQRLAQPRELVSRRPAAKRPNLPRGPAKRPGKSRPGKRGGY